MEWDLAQHKKPQMCSFDYRLFKHLKLASEAQEGRGEVTQALDD
jgi:hypothetical protein